MSDIIINKITIKPTIQLFVGIGVGNMPLVSTPSKFQVMIGNYQDITIDQMHDDSGFINTASISGTLVDYLGNNVDGCVSVNLPYVLGSNGRYQGFFGDSLFNPSPGTEYTMLINGSDGGRAINLQLLVEVIPRAT